MAQPRKAQIAIEFMMIIGIVFFAFIVIGIIVMQKNVDINRQKELLLLEDLAVAIQKEIIIAQSVADGYYREFEIPFNLQGYAFSLENSNDEVAVKSDRFSIHRGIPPISGTFQQGTNSVNKTEGVIYVN